MPRHHHLLSLSSLVLLAGLAATSRAAVQVICTKIPTSPTAVVPGVRDLAGAPVATNFRAMENLRVSPDGNHWVLKSRNQLGADLETMLIKGTGTSGAMSNANLNLDDVIVINNNRVILREGDPVDVNGNGLCDDNAFVGRGNGALTAWVTDGMFITANGGLPDGGVDINDPLFFLARLETGC